MPEPPKHRCGKAIIERYSNVLHSEGKCPLMELFGREWKGLLDTGSEISIIPAKVILQAQRDGYDIDRDIPEFPIDRCMMPQCDAVRYRCGGETKGTW